MPNELEVGELQQAEPVGDQPDSVQPVDGEPEQVAAMDGQPEPTEPVSEPEQVQPGSDQPAQAEPVDAAPEQAQPSGDQPSEPQPARRARRSTRSARKDPALLEAIETARDAVVEVSRPSSVGEHLGAVMIADRLAVHRFACEDTGYPGWAWEVSLARAPRSKRVTVCEIGLVPEDSALLAPDWVPWDQRLRPGDVSRDDVLPYSANDPRLISGFEQTDDEMADAVDVHEMGYGRPRVLSPEGISHAAGRWYRSDQGPARSAKAQANCGNCGFLVKIGGSLGQMFGVCGNEWSPDDGRVVSHDHTCGAHSETDVEAREPQWPIAPAKLDDFQVDVVTLGQL